MKQSRSHQRLGLDKPPKMRKYGSTSKMLTTQQFNTIQTPFELESENEYHQPDCPMHRTSSLDMPLQMDSTNADSFTIQLKRQQILPQYAQNFDQILCLSCEKILYKISKIFRQIHKIKANGGQEGVPGYFCINGQRVDMIDFDFNFSGNTQYDQIRILDYLDRFGTLIELYEKEKIETKSLICKQSKQILENQQQYKKKAMELDQTFMLFQSEKQKFKQKQIKYQKVIELTNQDMIKYRNQFIEIQKQLQEFKSEVNTYIEKQFCSKMENTVFGKQYKERLLKKEKQLYEWEAQIHTKKLEINGLKEYVKQKQDKLNQQSEDISKKITQMQNLSEKYEKMAKKAEEFKEKERQILQKEVQVQQILVTNDEILEHIKLQRELLKKDQLNVNYLNKKVQNIENRAKMEIEDYRSQVCRQINNLSYEKQTFQNSQILWKQKVEMERSKLDEELREKSEKSKIMELAIQDLENNYKIKEKEMVKVEQRVKQINNEKSKEIEDKIQEVRKEREILQNVMGLQDSYLTNNLKHSRSDIEIRSQANGPLRFKKKQQKNKDLELEGILVDDCVENQSLPYCEENLLDGLTPPKQVRSPFASSVFSKNKKKIPQHHHQRNKSQNQNASDAKSNFAAISIESFEIFK